MALIFTVYPTGSVSRDSRTDATNYEIINNEAGDDQRTDKLLDDKIVKMACVGDGAQRQSCDDMSILDDTKVINNSSDFWYILNQQKQFISMQCGHCMKQTSISNYFNYLNCKQTLTRYLMIYLLIK